MSAILLFDTLIYAKKLMNSGIPKEKAEAFAEAQKEALQDSLKNGIASKKDVIAVKDELSTAMTEIKKEINEVKTDNQIMRKEFQGKFNLLYWMVGFVLTFCITNLFFLLRLH